MNTEKLLTNEEMQQLETLADEALQRAINLIVYWEMKVREIQ